MSQTILITGATGFVGGYLTRYLSQRGYNIVALLRKFDHDLASLKNVSIKIMPDIGEATLFDWLLYLKDVNYVIHCAALAHIPNIENQRDRLWQINVEAVRKLALASKDAGVAQFIFLSSLKVMGEQTEFKAFTIQDNCFPCDLYAESKWAAEEAVRSISGLNWTIIRPPLIYGPNAKGNVNLILKALRKGIYLPLASIKNKRSVLGLGNLSHFMMHCLNHPGAFREIFLVSDGESVSTPNLIRAVATSQGLTAKLLPCPIVLLKLLAWVFRKQDAIEKLTQSLEMDISYTAARLDWRPPYTLMGGLLDGTNF